MLQETVTKVCSKYEQQLIFRKGIENLLESAHKKQVNVNSSWRKCTRWRSECKKFSY